MLEWHDKGIILSVRKHGENGGIASILTENYGRTVGYVYGITSNKKCGLFEIGNQVSARWHAKAQGQLGVFELELERSMAADVMDSPLKLTALQSACSLIDKTLAENEKHEGVFFATQTLIESFAGELWAPTYVYWEIGLLRELGFGLDLSHCVATGDTTELIYVSPKSGCAVSAAAGKIYKDKLLNLPPFLRGEAGFDNEDILDGLKLTGYFLLNRVFSQANQDLPDARLRLEQKYKTVTPSEE